MWIPLVLVGSVVYWTIALGLGRYSLSLLGESNDEELVNCPGSRSINARSLSAVSLPSPQTPGPVEVQIISGAGSGGNHSLDDGTGRLPAIDDSPPAPPLDEPPGRTSY